MEIVFENESTNWLGKLIKVFVLVHVISLLSFKEYDFTYLETLVLNAILVVLIVSYGYLTYIRKIEFSSNYFTVYYHHRLRKDKLVGYRIEERYSQIGTSPSKSYYLDFSKDGSTFSVSSKSFSDYDKLKEFLDAKNLLVQKED